ncbi:hypothetical protein A1O3_05018 [Capronia epimyces CBS 606.96]|uniref:Kinase n=1 Tax=Capronia epimyces CBS 606.96 TaxID=1182542 RepID=W9Y586_9EURO|nr:uncharacterized protein A1O3_05018 [Capronia epimyces CBS 606.96]EXJ84351.1 hypothetical protein A1O3_05018 [Capronia epimyces CBS 606.96]
MADSSASRLAAIPSAAELVKFDHSAAGHEGISSNASGSLIIKPCTQAEIDFYESAKAHPLFQAHIPTFLGSLSQNEDQEAVRPLLDAGRDQSLQGGPGAGTATVTTDPTPGPVKRKSWKPSGGKKLSTGLAVVLENVAAGFQHPNVLDVKLGARLWDDDAPVAKRQKFDEVAQRTTSGSLGFRIAGMKLWCPPLGGGVGEKEGQQSSAVPSDEPNVEWKKGYKSYNKFYGQSFSKDNVAEAFTTYLGGVRRDEQTGKTVFKRKRAPLIARRLIRELESIQYALENEESRMYSASVLLVYEGDEAALEVGLQEEEKEKEKEKERERERERSRHQVREQDTAEHDDEDEDYDDEQLAYDEYDDEEYGNEDFDDEDEQANIPRKVHEARLIDFAHASWTPGQGPDENVLKGIRSLLDILRGLVE